MKVRIVNAEEAQKLLARVDRGVYNEIYEAIAQMELGQAIVVDAETIGKAKKIATALGAMARNGHRFDGCYYHRDGSIIVIGKN